MRRIRGKLWEEWNSLTQKQSAAIKAALLHELEQGISQQKHSAKRPVPENNAQTRFTFRVSFCKDSQISNTMFSVSLVYDKDHDIDRTHEGTE